MIYNIMATVMILLRQGIAKPVVKLVNLLRRVIGRSVFMPMDKRASMESILSIMFHRLSATLYFIYAVWAVVAVLSGIPSLIAANGEQWQVIFSIAVFIFAVPSCFGATFWPSFARLELFAGAAFTTLLAIYIFFLIGNALFNGGSWSGFVIIASVMVVPLVRLIIVVIFLLRQADEVKARRERVASYIADLGTED